MSIGTVLPNDPVVNDDPAAVVNEGEGMMIKSQQSSVASDINFHEVFPRSLFSHTVRSNVDGFVTAGPALLFIVGSNMLIEAILGLGGVFCDKHAVRCAICITSTEMAALLGVYGFKPPRAHIMRKLFIQWPTIYIVFTLLSYTIFDWRPGLYTIPLITISYAIGMTSSYPTLPKETRHSFLAELIENFAISSAMHFGDIAFVFAQIIPTRLLAGERAKRGGD